MWLASLWRRALLMTSCAMCRAQIQFAGDEAGDVQRDFGARTLVEQTAVALEEPGQPLLFDGERGFQFHLALLQAPGRILQRLQNVLALEAGILGQQLVDAAPGPDLADDHADGDPHTAHAGLAAHDFGLPRDPVQRSPRPGSWVSVRGPMLTQLRGDKNHPGRT